MTRPALVALREDLHKRFNPDTAPRLTFLELQQYQLLMKRVNSADPFLRRTP